MADQELKAAVKTKKKVQKGTLEQVYNDVIFGHLNANTSAAAIGTTIMRWYIDKRRVLPNAFAMNGMISTYIA